MIKNVITKGRVPVKMWLDFCEDGAVNQAVHLSELPFVHKHVALMPDAHQGYGVPIGCVFGAVDVVIPNAVGVDIGCGMLAHKYDIGPAQVDKNTLTQLVTWIQQDIPVGFNHHDKAQNMPYHLETCPGPVTQEQFARARKQLGTLGGGNHFIEIQKDEDDFVWLMIHSGSRNVGKQVADFYNKKAKELNKQWGVTTPPQYQLAHMPITDINGNMYLREMEWCVEFAYQNRKHMAEAVDAMVLSLFGATPVMSLNIAHNYASHETHWGRKLVVHRKGATQAKKMHLGIIPGSQGTSSYIVRGLGNADSFQSCSHGAGRRMSRSKARQVLSLEEEQHYMDHHDIVHNLRSAKQLDEAPSAYKDIDEVMELQKDLVEVVHKLTPMAVVKA